jgi:hypothetical protein
MDGLKKPKHMSDELKTMIDVTIAACKLNSETAEQMVRAMAYALFRSGEDNAFKRANKLVKAVSEGKSIDEAMEAAGMDLEDLFTNDKEGFKAWVKSQK